MSAGVVRALILMGLIALQPVSSWGADDATAVRAALAKTQVRGGIVYRAYCLVCHGEIGDGISRAAKLYGAKQLQIRSNLPVTEYERIIRHGGEAIGRSPYMPPWQDELSLEQVNDVISYLAVVNQQIARGKVVYQTNCTLCHGINHDGQGRVSVLHDPKPSDLVHSDKSEEYKQTIVTLGGQALGRSSVMPPWGLQLSAQEIEDVVKYLGSIVEPKP